MDEVLARAGLFQGVDEEAQEALSRSFEFLDLARGSVIFKEGEQGDSLYMPSDSRHGCIPLEDDSQLVDCFTPQRDDFLS